MSTSLDDCVYVRQYINRIYITVFIVVEKILSIELEPWKFV